MAFSQRADHADDATGSRLRQYQHQWQAMARLRHSRPDSDVQLFVGEQLDARADILTALLRGMLLPLAVGLPLLALVVWLAVFRGLQPLRAAHPTAATGTGRIDCDRAARCTRRGASLTTALNDLFARIGSLIENERRFAQDAAHELRTPIAAIRAQAQVAASATAPADVQAALQKTLRGCDRASHLVDQLLQLARLDGAQQPSQQHQPRFDLARVVERVLAPLLDDAAAKRIALEVDVPNHCAMAGDEALIGILFRNLCDNALRYAPAEGQVRFRVADGTTTFASQHRGQRPRYDDRANCAAASASTGSPAMMRRVAALAGRSSGESPQSPGAKLDIGIIRRTRRAQVTVTRREQNGETGHNSHCHSALASVDQHDPDRHERQCNQQGSADRLAQPPGAEQNGEQRCQKDKHRDARRRIAPQQPHPCQIAGKRRQRRFAIRARTTQSR